MATGKPQILWFEILSTSIYDLVLIYVCHFHQLLLQSLFKFDHYRDTRAFILDPCIQGILLKGHSLNQINTKESSATFSKLCFLNKQLDKVLLFFEEPTLPIFCKSNSFAKFMRDLAEFAYYDRTKLILLTSEVPCQIILMAKAKNEIAILK